MLLQLLLGVLVLDALNRGAHDILVFAYERANAVDTVQGAQMTAGSRQQNAAEFVVLRSMADLAPAAAAGTGQRSGP